MPPLYRELIQIVVKMPRAQWRRIRLAVTLEELGELREFVRTDGNGVHFYRAVCGIPLQIEEHPTNPSIIMEILGAQPCEPPIQ